MNKKKIEKKARFFVRTNYYGFGYEVAERIFKPDGHIRDVMVRFRTSSGYQAKLVCKLFNDEDSYSNHEFFAEKDFKPVLICFGEKYGHNYFLLSRIEELYAVALKVLSERFLAGWYYEPKFVDRGFKLLSDDILQTLSPKLKQQYLDDKKDYDANTKEFQETTKQYLLIKKALNDKDGELALEILSERRDFEYEGFEKINYTLGCDIINEIKNNE